MGGIPYRRCSPRAFMAGFGQKQKSFDSEADSKSLDGRRKIGMICPVFCWANYVLIAFAHHPDL